MDSACKICQPVPERHDVDLPRTAGKQLRLVPWKLYGNTRRSRQAGAGDLAPDDGDLSSGQSEGDVLVAGRHLHGTVARPDVSVHIFERTAELTRVLVMRG